MIPIPIFAFLYGLSIPESPIFLNQVIMMLMTTMMTTTMMAIFYTSSTILFDWTSTFLGFPLFCSLSNNLSQNILLKPVEPGGWLQPDWNRTGREEGEKHLVHLFNLTTIWTIYISIIYWAIYHLTKYKLLMLIWRSPHDDCHVRRFAKKLNNHWPSSKGGTEMIDISTQNSNAYDREYQVWRP